MENFNKPFSELTKLEYFMCHSTWTPEKSIIDAEITRDRNLNPHNDSYKPKLRGYNEIILQLKANHFKEILKITEL